MPPPPDERPTPQTVSGWPSVDYLDAPRPLAPRPIIANPDALPTAAAFIKDATGRLVYADAALARFFEAIGIDWRGRTDAELWPADMAAQIREYDRRILGAFEPSVVEETVRQANGEHRWLVFKFPFRAADGQSYLAGMSLDITEQVRTREALESSEAHFRTLFESAAVGIAQVAPGQRIERVNQLLCDLFGYSREELVRTTWQTLVHPDDFVAGRADFAASVAAGRAGFQGVYRMIRRDGTMLWGDVSIAVVRDASGAVTYGIVAVQDVTAQRAAAAELARHRDRLEELVQDRTAALLASQEQLRHAERLASLGTLAAGVAHEINNPIGAVSLHAEWLLQSLADGVDPTALEARLREIVELAQRCGRVVRNVLTFAGQASSRKVRASLGPVVTTALNLTRAYVVQRGVVVERHDAARLPEVLLDLTGMEQVLVNLLRNAVDAGAGTIRVETACDGAEVVVAVVDDGAGMSPEVRDRMFDPFFTTRRENGGTGLGLSIVHGIVRDHGGRIPVESAVGAGTRIEVRLPIA